MLRGPGGFLTAAQEAELLSWPVRPPRDPGLSMEGSRVEARIGILRPECFLSSQREGLGLWMGGQRPPGAISSVGVTREGALLGPQVLHPIPFSHQEPLGPPTS